MRVTTTDNPALMYSVVPNVWGDWTRDVPWKLTGPHYVTTYSRNRITGQHQTAQARIRKDLFFDKFAEVDLAGTLRNADMAEVSGLCDRPAWRKRR